ncbi:hypothetical protein U1Q18_030465 [Sarracenia purpurea var. burkii]
MGSFSSETRSNGCGIFFQDASKAHNHNFEFPDETKEEINPLNLPSGLFGSNDNPPNGLFGSDGEDDPGFRNKAKKKKKQVFLEGFVEAADEENLTRTKSLTDDDLEELKGCLDLGFGFSYDEIPELCNTLPALELCYSMSQRFIDDHQKSPESSPSPDETCSSPSGPIANWKISSPGDHPEDVKARLKFWAQAVACTVRLCS